MVLEAYGPKQFLIFNFYEYKIGQDEWKQMKNNKLEISKDFDDLVYIRAVSKAGREGVISQIPVRVWKQKPELQRSNVIRNLLVDGNSENFCFLI